MALSRIIQASVRPGSVGQGGPVVTPLFTPPANSILVVRLTFQFDGGSGDNTGNFTLVDSSLLTWIPVVSAAALVPWCVNTRVWYAVVGASPAAMTVTGNDILTFNNRFVCALDVISYTGHNVSSPIGTSQGFADSVTGDGAWNLTLTTPPSATSEVIAFLGVDTDEQNNALPGAGWTELISGAGDYGCLESEYRNSSASASVSWLDTNDGGTLSYQRCAAVVEIKAAAASAVPNCTMPVFVPGL